MKQYLKEFEDLPTAELVDYLSACTAPFEPSPLYEVQTEERRIDPELRLSKFRTLTDPAIFAIAHRLVEALSARDEIMSYKLVQNDVTHIVYDKGGFFKAHQDYLSLTSNCVEEYTLLICVTLPEAARATQGGETRVEVSPGHEVLSKATSTPGSALLFRKDLVHEGMPVLEGKKEIVSLNIWASRRESEGVLVVTFPEDIADSKAPSPGPLQAVAESRCYALSTMAVRAFPTCILNGKLSFDAVASSKDGRSFGGARITTFECRDATYEEFETVFRVLNGLYVRPFDVVRHGRVLDFFGIPLDTVLVSVVNAGNAGKAQEEGAGFNVEAEEGKDGIVSLPLPDMHLGLGAEKEGSEASAAEDASADEEVVSPVPLAPGVDALADEAIIVCATEERALLVAEAAKQLGLPYARFRVLFVEGRLQEGGEAFMEPPKTISMQPVWATVGDYENLLACHMIWGFRSREDPGQLHEAQLIPKSMTQAQAAALETPGALIQYGSFSFPGIPSDVVEIIAPMGSCREAWTGLVGRPVKRDRHGAIKQFKKADVYDFLLPSFGYVAVPLLQVLPGGDDVATPFPFFHLDSHGGACFTAEEAKAASQHLIDIDFLAHVQSRIVYTPFLIPQEPRTGEAFFCNESVYGKLNFLEVTGVVRLAPLTKPLPAPTPVPLPTASDDESEFYEDYEDDDDVLYNCEEDEDEESASGGSEED